MQNREIGSSWQRFCWKWQCAGPYDQSNADPLRGLATAKSKKGLRMMKATTLLREQVQQAHDFLEATMTDVTSEQAHWTPPGTANPLAATYVHAIVSEDVAIQMALRGEAPLYASAWEGKTGISEIQPLSTAEWARRVKVDLPALRAYAQAVHAATDAYLASLLEPELERVVDLSSFGLGQMTVVSILNRLVLGHIDNMCGEISVLKGLQGGRGYPM